MTNLRTDNWKEFLLTDLFDIKGSKTTSLLELEEYGTGEYPYVTTKAINNGVVGFYNFYTEEGNVLTVESAVVGYCTYQPFPFSASDHVEKLIPKFQINEAVGLFLATIINQEQYRYNYGRKASQSRLQEQHIKLPAKNNKPDCKFMEEYIDRVSMDITRIVKEPSIDLNIEITFHAWKEFEFQDIFDIKKGKRLTISEQETGDIPYVSSSMFNNGVDNFIQNGFTDENCLSFATYGSIGSVFYHPNKAWISDNCNALYLKDRKMTANVAMFLKTILELEKYRFSYGVTAKIERIDKFVVKLPIKNNKPDWEFMEQYIKSLPYSANL